MIRQKSKYFYFIQEKWMKMSARWDFKIVDCWLSMSKPLKVYTSLIHKNTIPPPKKKSNWGRGAHARSAFELMIFKVYMIYSLTLIKCGMGEGSGGGYKVSVQVIWTRIFKQSRKLDSLRLRLGLIELGIFILK